MTTTELIKLLQKVEFAASGRPRNITFWKNGKKLIDDKDNLIISSTGDGCAGAELSLEIEKIPTKLIANSKKQYKNEQNTEIRS